MKFACDCGPGRALKVTDVRRSGDAVRRRYVCNHCYQRATTIEVVVAYDNSKPNDVEARRRLKAIKAMLFNENQ